MNGAKSTPTIDEIFASLEKGERLGIKEALTLVAASKRALHRSSVEQFFEAARAAARTRQAWQRLDIEVIDLNNISLADIEAHLQASHADKVFLQFPTAFPAETLFATIEYVAQHVPVGAFKPQDILQRSATFSMKVTEFCRQLAQAGLSFSSGRFNAHEFGTDRIDEIFSVMMQLAKAKIKVSASLPMSFSEEEKVLHLAKLREFHDRTQALDFVVLDLDAKFSDRELLRTVALMRLMLDNIDTISLADYDLSQENKLDTDLLRQCLETGLNLF